MSVRPDTRRFRPVFEGVRTSRDVTCTALLALLEARAPADRSRSVRGSRAIASACLLAAALSACGDKPSSGSGSSAASGPTGAPSTSASATTMPSASAAISATSPGASASAEPAPAITGSAVTSASARPGASAAPTASSAGTKADAGAPAASVVVVDAGTQGLPPPVAGSPDAIAADLDAVYLPKKTFKAKFVQKYKQKITGNEKESHGVVFVEKPNKISFRYDPPNKNRIVSDGTSVKVYIADDTQMFEQPVKGTEYPGALSFIMGEGIRSSFSFTVNDKAKFDKGPVLVGKPLAESPSYESALFYVDKDKLAKKDIGAMVAVLILDAQGNRNRFEFSDQETPDKIDPAEFSFTPPPGTTIQK